MRSRFSKIAYTISLAIFSTVSLHAFADTETYKVEESAYINSLDGSVTATCKAGDQLVKSLCADRIDAISVPKVERRPFAAVKDDETAVHAGSVTVENSAESARCKPESLRAEERLRLILTVLCKPSHS